MTINMDRTVEAILPRKNNTKLVHIVSLAKFFWYTLARCFMFRAIK
jgi:hypothetical protein